MSVKKAEKQAEKSKAKVERGERNSPGYTLGARSTPIGDEDLFTDPSDLMSAVVERENMLRALRRVESNRGSAGVDEMPVEALRSHLKVHWPRIKEELLTGVYKPQAVRRVEIPKPQGGVRQLGIPTVTDRLIQQALHQVLSPIFDKDFSDSSYGFRPGRSAHQALLKAQSHVREGYRYVVDMDLEKFFDRVNHDILVSRLRRKVKDTRIIALIYRYLKAGIMCDGVVVGSVEGTPQGGPLSPLLSNVMLDELDKELEKRGHRFCRYADDCNIYVKSRKAGVRILESLSRFLGRIKLKVNAAKSAVDRPWRRKFLGYTLTVEKRARLRVAPESVKRLKQSLREATRGEVAPGQALKGSSQDVASTGIKRGANPAECQQWSWAMVELWCLAHERRFSKEILQ